MQDLEAGKTYSIKIKNLAKQINPVIFFKIPAGGRRSRWTAWIKRWIYFSNMKLEGAPSFVRVDSVIDFDWEKLRRKRDLSVRNIPSAGLGKIVAPASIKNVSIDAATDDGVRVFIDGKKVIDDWRDRSPETDSYVMDMEAGKTYDIRIEYYQNGGGASARLAWNAGSGKTHGIFFGSNCALLQTAEMAPCMSFQIAGCRCNRLLLYVQVRSQDQIVHGMRPVTGKAPLYPKWAYGLFMSQYGWKTQEKIKSVIDGYRDRKIPLDVVVQDADYWPQFPNNLWGSHIFDSEPVFGSESNGGAYSSARLHIPSFPVWPRI